MRTAGIVVSILALICAGVGAILQRDAGDQLAAMRSLKPLELQQASVGTTGWIDAKVARPKESIRGPLTRSDVAWWELTKLRRWDEYDTCATKSDGHCDARWKDRTESIEQTRSADVVVIADGDTRAQVVVPEQREVKSLDIAKSTSRDEPSRDTARGIASRDGDRRDTRIVTEERSLRAGDALLVMGKVTRAGGSPRVEPLDGLAIATAGTTYERRIASLEKSQSAFGFMFYGGIAGVLVGLGLLGASVVVRRV